MPAIPHPEINFNFRRNHSTGGSFQSPFMKLFKSTQNDKSLCLCAGVFVLLTGRPSDSVNDLCACQTKVTAEIIDLMGKKILTSVSLSFSLASSAKDMTANHSLYPTILAW